MIEIAAAISMANAAFNTIKGAVEKGREIEDVAGYFGRFFDARDAINEATQESQNQPAFKKMFSGQSVEAQALEVTAARHKINQLEAELRDYLLWSGQGNFYEDMMRERRSIRQARAADAKRKAENKKLMIDLATVGTCVLVGSGMLIWVFTLLFSASA
jgi:hypothetical protein